MTTTVLVAGLVALVPGTAQAAGTTYLVQQGNSSCSDTGTGSSSAPLCSISAAAKKALLGDTVQVDAGEYHEQVNPADGVTLRATTKNAVVVGTDDLSSATWSQVQASSTGWSTVLGPNAQPAQVFARGSRLTKALAANQMTTGSWFYDSPTKKLYVDLGGSTVPTAGDAVEIVRSYGFRVKAGPAGVIIDGFTVRAPGVAGVFLEAATGATVTNVDVTESLAYGVNVVGGSGNQFSSLHTSNNASIGVRFSNSMNNSLTSSVSDHNRNHGVSMQGGSGNRVAGVTASYNVSPPGQPRVATGIDVNKDAAGVGSVDAVVEQNTTFNNGDSGIEIYQGSTGAVVRRNESYDNGDHGIDISAAAGATVVSNTVVGNGTPGINVEGTSTSTTLRDNIAVDNAVASTGTHGDIRVDEQSVTGTTIDRDLVFQTDSARTIIEWARADYTSLSAFRAAQPGQETRGLSADPKFGSLSGRDLGLTIQSPAVDAADSDVTGWFAADRTGASPVDQPTVVDTGRGTPTYADMGALELTEVTAPPVDDPPHAALTFTPAQPTVGEQVTLDATGSSDDKSIASYAFDCGNGTSAPAGQSATTTCTYGAAGDYTASVTVTDSGNQTGTASKAVTVTAVTPPPPPVDNPPQAALSVTPAQPMVGEQVTLDASGSTDDNAIASFAFDCGNGTTIPASQSNTASCSYIAADTYTASVTVTDSGNQTGTASKAVTVTAVTPPPPPPPVSEPPSASLVVSHRRPRQLVPVTLDASGSSADALSAIAPYRFYCGKGRRHAAQQTPITTCTYRKMGTYIASVVVTDSHGQASTATRKIVVRRGLPPTARLGLSARVVRRGELVKADASGSTGTAVSSIKMYRIDCGNGHDTRSATRSSMSCRFFRAGRHTITAWVKSTLGLVDTRTKTLWVRRR